MKILFLAGWDSCNYPFPNIINAFKKNGHEVTVLCLYKEYYHTKMFTENVITYTFVEDFPMEELKEYRVAFVGEGIPYDNKIAGLLRDNGTFIFTMAVLFLVDQQICNFMYSYADIILCMGHNFVRKQKRNKIKTTCIAVGNPQFDSMLDIEDVNEENSILFIDAGLYPIGSKGKIELAEMLVEIALKCKEYNIIVKPRYLPDETSNQTHTYKRHLYDYITDICSESIPENLILLKKHENLETLIKKAKCVITTFSSAHLEAVFLDKSLLLVEGLSSEDCDNFNENLISSIYKKLDGSGCTVSHKEICRYLPEGLKTSSSYAEDQIYECGSTSSYKVVEIAEFIYEKVVKNGIYLPYLEMNCENYKSVIKEYILVNYEKGQDFERINSFNKLNKEIDRIINRKIDELNRVDKNTFYSFGEDSYNYLYEKLTGYKNKLLMNCNENEHKIYEDLNIFGTSIVDGLILEFYKSNKEKFMKNRIVQANYIKYMYDTENFNEILRIKEDILAKEAYFLYYGKYLFNSGKYKEATDNLRKYIELEENKDYFETIVDNTDFKISGYFYLGVCYYNLGDYSKALEYFIKCQQISGGKHKKADEYIQLCNQRV